MNVTASLVKSIQIIVINIINAIIVKKFDILPRSVLRIIKTM